MDNKYSKFLDSDYPLLSALKEGAPGTYKHSQNLADICMSVAAELDLDKDLVRCAALYHDIGKIFNPEWFTENQDEKDPHEDADPELSYQVITRHISDSVLILTQHDFPSEVTKIVSCHHGNSVLLYFWKKNGKNGEKDSYRYKSLVPQDVHANILMVCDRVEAAAKSLFTSGKLKTAKSREDLIEEMFSDLMEDGQLDNLTFGVGRVIKKVLQQELRALYHDRVDYDDEEINGDN
jgi:putative nucleotidyltransferase with HDIG domain